MFHLFFGHKLEELQRLLLLVYYKFWHFKIKPHAISLDVSLVPCAHHILHLLCDLHLLASYSSLPHFICLPVSVITSVSWLTYSSPSLIMHISRLTAALGLSKVSLEKDRKSCLLTSSHTDALYHACLIRKLWEVNRLLSISCLAHGTW